MPNKDEWVLYFGDGRQERFTSREAAEDREKQIQYFKRRQDAAQQLHRLSRRQRQALAAHLADTPQERADATDGPNKKPRVPSHRRLERLLRRRVALIRELVMRRIGADLARAERAETDERADALDEYVARILAGLTAVETVMARRSDMRKDLQSIGESAEIEATRQTNGALAAAAGRRVRAIPAFTQGPAEGLVGSWVENNVNLIKTISSTVFSQLREVVETGAREGTNTKAIAKQIEERFGVARSRARFIARDQVATLNGQITEKRQTDTGIKSYRWSTSDDERVRPTHAQLDGLVFQWNDPPVTNKRGDRNHPGGDYNCRCVALPILPNS